MTIRLPVTQLTLPNDFEDIKVPVNRIADNTIINSKVALLEENFQYLLDAGAALDNNIPFEYSGAYYFTDAEWKELSSYESQADHNYLHVEVVEKTNGQYLYILAKSDRIEFLVGADLQDDTFTTLSNQITYLTIKNKGNQNFRNITYIKVIDDLLYVYDADYQNLVVYDISALVIGDVAIDNLKFIKQYIRFKNVTSIDKRGNVYILTNNKLYFLNNDLNIKKTVSLNTANPKDFVVISNEILVLYGDKIDKYNLTGTYTSSYTLTKLEDETFISLRESFVNTNEFYLLTEKNIYKILNETNEFVGYFSLGALTRDKPYVDFDVKETASGYDEIFVLDENKLHYFRDKNVFKYLYDVVNLADRVSTTDIRLENLELEQDYVYNALVQKLLFNTLLLYNSMIFKGYVNTDTNGVLKYLYRENLVNLEVLNPDLIYMGQNEVFSFQLFNKSLKGIYDIQVKILALLAFVVQEDSTNTLTI